VHVTTAAAHKGLGVAELARIEVEGADLQGLRTRFKRPPGGVNRGFPAWLGRLMEGKLWVRPLVVRDKCTACGACAAVCPAQAITIGNCAVIDSAACIECFCCQEVCPQNAIDTRRSLLARGILGSGGHS
jgi:ferredoxin